MMLGWTFCESCRRHRMKNISPADGLVGENYPQFCALLAWPTFPSMNVLPPSQPKVSLWTTLASLQGGVAAFPPSSENIGCFEN